MSMFPTRAYMPTGDAEQLNSSVASLKGLKDDDFQTFFFFFCQHLLNYPFKQDFGRQHEQCSCDIP